MSGKLISGSAGVLAILVVGCAPIGEETRMVTRELGTETYQEVIHEELKLEVSMEGEDPRSDAVILVDLVKHRRCEEGTLTRTSREEHTDRKITNWTIPLVMGMIGTAAASCSILYVAGGDCGSDKEEETGFEEPISPVEQQGMAVLWGSIAVASFSTIVVDLFRARNSVERLEDLEQYAAGSEVACGSAPSPYQEVEHRWTSTGPVVWRGQTDAQGQLRIPMSEVNWIDDGGADNAGVIVVSRALRETTPEPPQSWMEARADVRAERDFEVATEMNQPSEWLLVFERYSDTSRGEEAFARYLSLVRLLLTEEKWEEVGDTLEQAVSSAPSRELIEQAQSLQGRRALLEARAAVAGQVERAYSEILTLYQQAVRYASGSEQASQIRDEGWEFALPEARAMVREQALGELDREDTQESLRFLAASPVEEEVLEELIEEIGLIRVEELEVEAVRLASDPTSSKRAIRQAYGRALQAATIYDSPRREALDQEYAALHLESVEHSLARLDRNGVVEAFRQAHQRYEGDEEVLRRAYFDMLLMNLRESTKNLASERAQIIMTWALAEAQSDEEEAEVVAAWAEELVSVLIDGYEEEGVPLVSMAREFVTSEQWGESYESEQAQEIFAEQTERLRQGFADKVRLRELQSLDDILWLFPPSIRSRGQLQALLDQPGRYVNRRALITFRAGDSLGDGGRLGELIRPSGQVVVYGLGSRNRRETTALVSVTGTLGDSRGSGGGEIPVVRVLWVQ